MFSFHCQAMETEKINLLMYLSFYIQDQAPEKRTSFNYCSLAGELRATQVNLDCLQKKSFAIGSQNWDKFCSFFDKVKTDQ